MDPGGDRKEGKAYSVSGAWGAPSSGPTVSFIAKLGVSKAAFHPVYW